MLDMEDVAGVYVHNVPWRGLINSKFFRTINLNKGSDLKAAEKLRIDAFGSKIKAKEYLESKKILNK